ncbi:MAG: hypothetical protein ACKVWV_11840 [Planctomycetota bacterium]
MTRRLVAIAFLLALLVLGVWSLRPKSDPFVAEAPAIPSVQEGRRVALDGSGERDTERASPVAWETTLAPVEPIADPQPAEALDATLVVRVIDKRTAAPLDGLRVGAQRETSTKRVFRSSKESRGAIDSRLTSDERGEVEFACPSGVTIDVFAVGHDDVGRARDRISALAVGERRVVTLRVATGADLEFCGRVIAETDRTPIADAWVTLQVADEPRRSAQTDVDGRFRVECSSWKEPLVRVLARGFAPRIVYVGEGHRTPERALEIVLPRAATLEVFVTGAVDPRRTVSVTVSARGGDLVAAAGSNVGVTWRGDDFEWGELALPDDPARFENLPSRIPLSLTVEHRDRIVRCEPSSIVLAPGELRRIEIPFEQDKAMARVFGRVVDENGDPIVERTVWLVATGAQERECYLDADLHKPSDASSTDESGMFELLGVRGGTWWVGLAPPRAPEESVPEPGHSRARWIEVPSHGEDVRVDLVAHRGLFVAGRIVGPRGEIVTHGIVRAIPEDARGLLAGDVASDGSFSIGPLAPGQFQLLARADRFGSSRGELCSAGDTNVVVELDGAARTDGTVRDGDSGAPVSAIVSISWTDATGRRGFLVSPTADDGRFQRELDGGRYTLLATTGDGRIGMTSGVELRTGGVAEDVEILVRTAGGTVRATYRGHDEHVELHLVRDGILVGAHRVARGASVDMVIPAGRIVANWRNELGVAHEESFDLAVGEVHDIAFESAK